MRDEDRKRVERIDAIRRFHRTTHPGPCDTCFLLAIIDRERVATREDVERVAQAIADAERDARRNMDSVTFGRLLAASESFPHYIELATRAALRAMEFEVKE